MQYIISYNIRFKSVEVLILVLRDYILNGLDAEMGGKVIVRKGFSEAKKPEEATVKKY
jgi:hypothetical protein